MENDPLGVQPVAYLAVMIKRNRRGHLYCYVRGEILGS